VKSALLLTVIIGFLVTGCSGSRPGNLAGSWYVITLPSPALVLFNPTGAEYRSAGTTPSDTIFLAHTFDDSVRASLFYRVLFLLVQREGWARRKMTSAGLLI